MSASGVADGHAVIDALAELERARGGRAVALLAGRLDAAHAYVLYECLRRRERAERLDLVLLTSGGDVDATRRIALLLHEHTDRLAVLVPDHAESAGTLLCLAADELVLGPMAQLGPIDPHISAVGEQVAAPGRISAEDIRLLPLMAGEWFGLDERADRLEVFSAVSQRLFPTTLSTFYRADRNIRRAGRELIARQRPDLTEEDRARIIDELVSGYDSHGHAITRTEAAGLGLAVTRPSPGEEELMWRCTEPLRAWHTRSDEDGGLLGLVADADGFLARQLITAPAPDQPPRPYWEFDHTGGERAC
ncbi:SDH family Clp fold serine proteinase [Nonomuraea helvata]|uniref:Serine dehydrogenase proteinase n=1 Tax=Nonomuraea helvata TaxID=37484 RepID=A0ABV5RTS3_9ACTN